jgi:ABC-type sugar transport system permease subunit
MRPGRLASEAPRSWWTHGPRFPRRPKRSSARSSATPIVGGRGWGPLLGVPAVFLLVVFFLYPFAVIVFHAFTAWDGIAPSEWIGLDNFAALLEDPSFRTAIRNNALFALVVPLQVAVSFVIAVLLYERTPGWRLFRAIFFLPVVMSPIVIGLMWTAIFDLNGPLNAALDAVGLDGVSRDWLAGPETSIPAIMIVVLWASFGFNMTIFLAGLSAMPPTLVDAAHVDGAGWWATLRHVIVPSQRRSIELVAVLNLITAFAYMLPFVFVMTGGGPGHDTYVAEYLIYDEGFTFGELGFASAISLTLFAVVCVLMFAYVRLLRGNER